MNHCFYFNLLSTPRNMENRIWHLEKTPQISVAAHIQIWISTVVSRIFRLVCRLGLHDWLRRVSRSRKKKGTLKGRERKREKRQGKQNKEHSASCEFLLQRSNQARSYRPKQQRMRTAKVRRTIWSYANS